MLRSSVSVALFTVSLVGCASRGGGPVDSYDGGPLRSRAEVRNTPANDLAEYRAIAEYEQLERIVERDAAARDFGRVKEGLDAFMRASILDGHAMRGHGFLSKLRPVWRLQGVGGESHVASVEQQLLILEHAGRDELASAHASIERGDWDALRRLRAQPRSVLGAETVAFSPTLAPHAALVDALLRYDGVRATATRGAAEAKSLAADLEAVAPALERDGFGSLGFLARIAAAEVLDMAGLESQAVERWLALLESKHLAGAPESVQVAIAVRLKGYTDRLREDLTRRIRAEEQALADAQVRELEAKHAKLSKEQRARVEALEAEVARVRAQTQAEVRDNLATQRALFEGTLTQQEQRIRDLERLFAELAIARDWEARGEVAVEAVTSAVSFSADVVSLWTAANRGRSARVPPAGGRAN